MGTKKSSMQQSIDSTRTYGTSNGKSLHQISMDTFVRAVNEAEALSKKAAYSDNPTAAKMAAFETALLNLYEKIYYDDLNRSKKPIATISANMNKLVELIKATKFQSEFTFIMLSGVAKQLIEAVENKREYEAKSQNQPGSSV